MPERTGVRPGVRRRVRIEDIASLENLTAAFWRAASGKRGRVEVREFEANLDRELADLSAEILAGTVEVGRLRTFEIHDPKRRTIHAPCFRERVLHHAVMAHVGPTLERSLVFDTFACREGKGTLAAVLRAQALARRYEFFAKLDVRAFFASIDHEILGRLLRRRLEGARVLVLLGRIVASHTASQGRGLPIGSLCSQHLANLYLAGLDRSIAEGRFGLVRYMDDVVIWGHDRAELRDGVARAVDFARERLRLDLEVVREPSRTERGVPLCGFQVFGNRLLLSSRRRSRYAAARRLAEGAYSLGLIEASALQRAGTAALAITAHADARGWRRSQLMRSPVPDV